MNEERLTVEELSERIKHAKQTIYNNVHKKVFVRGIHYTKPNGKKLLFKWSAIEEWLEGTIDLDAQPYYVDDEDKKVKGKEKVTSKDTDCRIKI